MHQFEMDLESAMQWVAAYHAEVETKFLDGLKRLPSRGLQIDRQVQQYVDGLGNWVRGHDCWNFESGRYFGSKGREIQKTRYVALYPKLTSPPMRDITLRRENGADDTSGVRGREYKVPDI